MSDNELEAMQTKWFFIACMVAVFSIASCTAIVESVNVAHKSNEEQK